MAINNTQNAPNAYLSSILKRTTASQGTRPIDYVRNYGIYAPRLTFPKSAIDNNSEISPDKNPGYNPPAVPPTKNPPSGGGS